MSGSVLDRDAKGAQFATSCSAAFYSSAMVVNVSAHRDQLRMRMQSQNEA